MILNVKYVSNGGSISIKQMWFVRLEGENIISGRLYWIVLQDYTDKDAVSTLMSLFVVGQWKTWK